MVSALQPFVMETNNCASLCHLLVDVGYQALKDTFDKIYPPAGLHEALKCPQAKLTLQTLKKNGVLSIGQWNKLYPTISSSVSSSNFDITLLLFLLKNICGLNPPATGWDSLPSTADTSIKGNIARVIYYRNTLCELHGSQASVDDATFNSYWQNISDALVGLGAGANYLDEINRLKTERMDSGIEEYYQVQLTKWREDDVDTKSKCKRSMNFGSDLLRHIKVMHNIMQPSLQEYYPGDQRPFLRGFQFR